MKIRLNSRQISVFSAVMRLGSTSAACDFLHISQPAVSKTLSSMENELGYALFRRTGRGLEPTAKALALQPHVDRVLTEFDRLQSNAAVIGHGLTGTLSIGGNHSLVSRVATFAAVALRGRHPEIGLRLSVIPADELLEHVIQHKIDVGLMYNPVPTHQVTSEQLYSCACACVFPANHRFSRMDRVSLDDLRGEPFLTYSVGSPTERLHRRLFEENGWEFEPAITFGDTFSLLQAVSHGVGIGLVDNFDQFKVFFQGVRSLPFLPEITLNAMLITSNSPTSNPAFPILLDELKAAAKPYNHQHSYDAL